MLLRRPLSHIFTVDEKLQIELARQARNKLLIAVRFRPTQLVIEMNNRHYNPQLAPQLQQHPQQRDRINSPGNRHTYAVSGPQQFLPTDVVNKLRRQRMHEDMVQPEGTAQAYAT